MYITNIYLPICDTQSGDFRMLPFEGPIGDQPYMTMLVLRIIQGAYREFQHEKNMKALKGAKKGR